MPHLPDDAVTPGPGALPELRRLGKNLDGYRGETIDIDAVVSECEAAAHAHGWTVHDLPAGLHRRIPTLFKAATGKARPEPLNIYISAGIHGDEPAAPLAALRLLQENLWPPSANVWLCPCLNPTGFLKNSRENEHGTDLNRQYLQPQAKEIIAHIAWLEAQPAFDLCLCLHEDWESHGFYLYELNPDQCPSPAQRILRNVSRVCPIDRSEVIEGRRAKDGLILPSLDPRTRLQWPEAFFLIIHKTRLCYTFEAPSDFALGVRVKALTVAVETAIGELVACKRNPTSL
jgi:protein MpaA